MCVYVFGMGTTSFTFGHVPLTSSLHKLCTLEQKFIIPSAVVMLVVSLSPMSKWQKENRGGAYVSLSPPVLQWYLLKIEHWSHACLAPLTFYTACAVPVTIFSTGRKLPF